LTPERAWFLQARSDLETARLIEGQGGDVCQVIMHLQMASEKLVKGHMRRARPNVPRTHEAVHNHFSHLSATVINDEKLRTAFMGRTASRQEVSKHLRGLQGTMRKFELLNPSLAGRNAPNCEYPWESPGPPPQGHSPVKHRFGNAVGKAARYKVYRLLDRILLSERA